MSTITQTQNTQLLGICTLATKLYDQEHQLAQAVVVVLGEDIGNLNNFDAANDGLFGYGESPEKKLKRLLSNFEIKEVVTDETSTEKVSYTLAQLEQARQYWFSWLVSNSGIADNLAYIMLTDMWNCTFQSLEAWSRMDFQASQLFFMNNEGLFADRDRLIQEAIELGLVLR